MGSGLSINSFTGPDALGTHPPLLVHELLVPSYCWRPFYVEGRSRLVHHSPIEAICVAPVFLGTTNKVTPDISVKSFEGHVSFWRTDIYAELKKNNTKTSPNTFHNGHIILRIQYCETVFYFVIKMVESCAILGHKRITPRFHIWSTQFPIMEAKMLQPGCWS